MNAPDIVTYGHLTLLGALDGLAEEDWTAPGACGVWSVKEIVAHLASYEEVLVDVLASLLEPGPTPCLDRFLALGAAFNDAEVGRRRGLDPAATLAELNGAHARRLELVAAIPPETLRRPGTLPWYGAGYAADDLLVYMDYGHKREHAAQIALVRDRRAAPPAAHGGTG